MRGLVAHWPLVAAGRTSADEAADYLAGFYQGAPVTAFLLQSDDRTILIGRERYRRRDAAAC